MTQWTELHRNRNSRVYRDSADPARRLCAASLVPLHQETAPGSGTYTDPVDLTPIRVQNAQLDGWRVTAADWHYAIGQPAGQADGWIGFGGRQGAHWFRYRLARSGYLHWPTRAWDDLGGSPTYNRANLAHHTRQLQFGPQQETITVENVAAWTSIWTTPGGGSLDLRWAATPAGLKEDITVNQAARAWIAANRPPTTPPPETFFGFIFQVDWSDIPTVLRQQAPVDVAADFDDGDEPLVLQDALDRVIALLPIGLLGIDDLELPLRKRFWKDGDDHYMLVGLRCDHLAGLPSGDLRFDPTVDTTVPSASDDGRCYDAGTKFSSATATPYLGYRDSEDCAQFFRWTGVTLEGTITTSYAKIYSNDASASSGSPQLAIHGVDEDNPAAPTSAAEFAADPLTTAKADWDTQFTDDDWQQTPSLNTIFQELVDAYTISGDAVMVQIHNDGPTSDNWNRASHYNDDASHAAQLYIEYTTGSGATIPVINHHYRRRRVP